MKHFEDLTAEQQEKAVEYAASKLLQGIIMGAVRFSDEKNGDNLQARIDAAIEQAEKMQTPWFAHEYIMETCKDEVLGMARADAEDTLYSEEERVVSLDAIEATAIA